MEKRKTYPVDLPFDVKGFVYRDKESKQWFVREESTKLAIGYGKYFSKDEAIKGAETEMKKLGAYVVLCTIQQKLNKFSEKV
jgi:hypothetical protein